MISCDTYAYTDDGGLNAELQAYKVLQVEKPIVGIQNDFSRLTDNVATYLIDLYSGTNPSVTDLAGNQVGMVFAGSPGSSKEAKHFPGGGELTDVQLILAQWDQDLVELSTNGEYCLDNTFPYGALGSLYLGPGGSADIVIIDDSDVPEVAGIFSVIVQTDYSMNIIYRPSSPGASWVPATQFEWTWNASDPRTVGQPDGTAAFTSNEFPEWDHVFSNRGHGH